jgi:signal peptidase II
MSGEPDPQVTGSSSAGAVHRISNARRWVPLALAAGVVLLVDQLSKYWAFSRLCEIPDGYDCAVQADPIALFWTLRFNLAFNTGMAFSAGSGSGPVIGLVVIAIVVVLIVVARRITSPVQLVLLGVVIGGALGNLVDRAARATDGLLDGAVVDFIDLQWWPVFNVADLAVVVGGIALALTGLTTEDRTGRPEGADPGDRSIPIADDAAAEAAEGGSSSSGDASAGDA